MEDKNMGNYPDFLIVVLFLFSVPFLHPGGGFSSVFKFQKQKRWNHIQTQYCQFWGCFEMNPIRHTHPLDPLLGPSPGGGGANRGCLHIYTHIHIYATHIYTHTHTYSPYIQQKKTIYQAPIYCSKKTKFSAYLQQIKPTVSDFW